MLLYTQDMLMTYKSWYQTIGAPKCICSVYKDLIIVSNSAVILPFQSITSGTMRLRSDWLVVEEIVDFTLLKNTCIK